MRVITMMLVVLLMLPVASYSAKGGEKGSSDQAYEHASDQSIFKRVGNWFSSKSDEEKDAMKAEREQAREQKRAEK